MIEPLFHLTFDFRPVVTDDKPRKPLCEASVADPQYIIREDSIRVNKVNCPECSKRYAAIREKWEKDRIKATTCPLCQKYPPEQIDWAAKDPRDCCYMCYACKQTPEGKAFMLKAEKDLLRYVKKHNFQIIHIISRGNKWAVKRLSATRATRVFEHREQAFHWAMLQNPREVVVQDRSGNVVFWTRVK